MRIEKAFRILGRVHRKDEQLKTGKIIQFPLERRSPYPRLKAYTLRVDLVRGPCGKEQEGQEIFRTLQIRGDQTLEDLHFSILCAFEREEDRNYEFATGEDPFGPSCMRYICWEEGQRKDQQEIDQTSIARFVTLDSLKLEPEQILSYRFDLTEEWGHLIHVERVDPVQLSHEYPVLIEKVGSVPEPVTTVAEKEEDLKRGVAFYPDPSTHVKEILSLLMNESRTLHHQKWEEISLRPNTRLKTALDNLPSYRLDGMALLFGIRKTGPRETRIARLLERLPEEKYLQRMESHLPVSAKKLLEWILEEKGGWATIRQVSNQFGQMQEFGGWSKEEQIPITPLGMLRLCGLAFVGKAKFENRKVKIVTIPVEVRRPLKEVLHTQADPKIAGSLLDLFFQAPSHAQPSADSSRKILTSQVPIKSQWKLMEKEGLEEFLETCPLEKDSERFYTYMLGRVRREPERFPKKEVRKFLKRLTQDGSAWNRLAAYKLGVSVFDKRFARAARKDQSSMVRQWADEMFESRQEELF